MPNIKSAKKRVLVIKTKTMQNKIFRTQLKTDIKKYQAALAAVIPLLLSLPTRLLLRRLTRLPLVELSTRMPLPVRRASLRRPLTICNFNRVQTLTSVRGYLRFGVFNRILALKIC